MEFVKVLVTILSLKTRCSAVVQGAPLSCLWFGPVYLGTSRLQNVVLRNNAPQACDWVCLLQDTAAGTEVVSVGEVGAAKHLHSCCVDRHVCI